MSAPYDDGCGCGSSHDDHLEAVERELLRSEREAVRRLVDARRAEVAQLRQVNRRLRVRLKRAKEGAELSPWGTPRGLRSSPGPTRHDVGSEPARNFRPAARPLLWVRDGPGDTLRAGAVGALEATAGRNMDHLRREVARIRAVLGGGAAQELETVDELEPEDCRLVGVAGGGRHPEALVTSEEADLITETRSSRLRVQVLERELRELRQPGLLPPGARLHQRRLLQMSSIASQLHDSNFRRRAVGPCSSSPDTQVLPPPGACFSCSAFASAAAESSPDADVATGSSRVIWPPCAAPAADAAPPSVDAASDVKTERLNEHVRLMTRRLLIRRDVRCR